VINENIAALLADKYTSEEIIEKLGVDSEDVIGTYEELIMDNFCEGGAFEDEWRDYYGDEGEAYGRN
jgi:hypothetical protein